MSDHEVVIIGGGIAGASIGSGIAHRRRTLIIEAENYCGFHSTGRSAAFWLESYGGPKVGLLTAASHEFLQNPPGDFVDHCLLRTRGALHVSRDCWAELPDGVDHRRLARSELERLLPGVRPDWRFAVFEPGCADIDVAALHSAYLRRFKRRGGQVATGARLAAASFDKNRWAIELADGSTLTCTVLVNAAGAWADPVAESCGVRPAGIAPKRRTMVQLRIGRSGLRGLPLVNDTGGTFYFKGEGDRGIWLSPHDEIETAPCDAAPEEIDVATAIDRFESVVYWPVERVERSWAGLRSFAPDRLPVYGFDEDVPGFFWAAGQGGFGIQSAPAAARLAESLLLDEAPGPTVAHIDPLLFSPGRLR